MEQKINKLGAFVATLALIASVLVMPNVNAGDGDLSVPLVGDKGLTSYGPMHGHASFTGSVTSTSADADDNVTGVTGTYTSTEKPLKDVYTIPVASSDGFSDGDKIASSANHSSAGKTGNIISKEAGKLHVEVTKGNWANGNTVRGIKPDGTGALSPAVSTTISGSLSLHSRGLQWSKIQEVKDIQGSKLQPYDWYVVRKADDGTAIPSAVQTYRDGVRTKATAHETAVSATTNVTELIAVNIGDGWPDEPST